MFYGSEKSISQHLTFYKIAGGNMSGKCLIISGGEFDNYIPAPADYVIACDKGYEHALKLGISPDIVIGDLDSVTVPIPQEMKTIALPTAKDDTDTSFAVKYAISLGYDDITLICALGGRVDHAYSNTQTLCAAARQGAAACILSTDTVIHAVCGSSVSLKKRDGWAFSVFSATDTCSGVTITGAEYNVENIDMYNTYPIGQSNGWASDEARISCLEGTLLVIEAKI